MKLYRTNILAVILSLSVATVFIGEAAEQEKVSPLLEKGIGQYKHENYDEALISLKKVREEDPRSTLAAYYLGLTYKQMQNYTDAIPHLRDAVTYPPKIKGALVELVDCLYQMGKLEEARKWITEAEIEGIRPAQIAFLKGLVLMKDDQPGSAIAAFENAMELDRSMEQACKYQIGICYLKEKNFSDARKAFGEVTLVDPGSTMANFANEYMNAIKKREEATRPFRFSFGTAWQYDDNVILMPADTSLATDITDKADSREVYTAKAQYEKRFGDNFGIMGQYMFYYAKQNDLGFYDMGTNVFMAQPSIYFKNSMLTFPIAYNHTTVNDKAYLSSPSTTGIYNLMVGASNMGQVYLRYQYKGYLWDPSTADEGRTGNDLGGGAAWYFFYADNKGFLNLRYSPNKEWTTGNNWEYVGNRVNATVLVPALDKLNITVSGDMFMQNFTNSHTVFHIYRKDQVYTLSTLIAYKFYKDSEVQLQYTFVKDSSNISIYDYTRSVYSAGVEIKF